MSRFLRSTLGIVRRLLAPALLASPLFFTSCSWSLSDLNPRMHASDDVSASYQQVRLQMRSLVDPMGGQIESSADKILATTADPTIKRAALEWKAQGVPALRESLFQPEPTTALFDTWVLLFQMEAFYQSGQGATSLGSASPQAVATIRRMENDFHQIVQSFTISKNVSESRKFAQSWAAQHPIQNAIAYRESTLTRSTQVDMPDDFTASNAIADITLTVDDLNRRIEIYSDQVVRQARWEAQLLTMDLSDQLELDQAMPLAGQAVDQVASLSLSVGDIAESVGELTTTIDTIVPIVDRLATVAEATPQLISTERAHAIKAAQDEITRTIKSIQEERIIALNYISTERQTALETLQDTVTAERKQLTADVAIISTELVDHAFTRIIQLVIGLLLVGAVAGITGLFIIRRMISGLIAERMTADGSS